MRRIEGSGNRRRLCWQFVIFSVLMTAGGTSIRSQQSPSPREQLSEYVADLQKNPSDDGLREKIIKLALTLEPKPVVPREAKEHEGAAEYAFKHVQSPADFQNAAAEYEKALLIAPWVAGDYYNLAVCYDKAGDPAKAIAGYQLYLVAAPDSKDADDVIKQIGALKYQVDKRKEQARAARAEQQARAVAAAVEESRWQRLGWTDGAVWRDFRGEKYLYHFFIEVHGREVWYVMRQKLDDNSTPLWRYFPDSRHFVAHSDNGVNTSEVTLSDDGQTVSLRGHGATGDYSYTLSRIR